MLYSYSIIYEQFDDDCSIQGCSAVDFIDDIRNCEKVRSIINYESN